jgi:cation diffusion facilitator family transporter
MSKKNKVYYSYLEGIISIVVNIIIFVLKYWIGVITGSVAFITDAWHSLSDSISSIVLIVGAKASTKPADEEHPFGHGRAEYVAALIIGVFLAIVAYNFIIEAWEKFQSHEPTEYGTSAFVVIIVSIILKELLAQFAFWSARKTNSLSLKADGWHHRSDALSSVVILIGIFISPYFWWIDSAMALIVALMIFWAAIKVMRDTISSILGKEAPEELKLEIKRICNETAEREVRPHHIHVHSYGNHSELTMHIKFPKETSLIDAHKTAVKIERELKQQLDLIATIKIEAIV